MTVAEELKICNLITGARLKQLGVSKLWMTSYGNSISAGYSMLYPTIPLLLRNTTLEKNMRDCGIELTRYQFARAQNNNEDHTLYWLLDNITQLELHQMNRKDYDGGKITMPGKALTKEELDLYFPLDKALTRGLQDIITTASEEFANIVIYNGATGSLIDNLTRKGKHKNLSGVTRDIRGLDAILRIIQDFNRERGCETQVYLCGVPDVLGIHASEIVNARLKGLSKQFANVVYVEPIAEQFFHIQNGKLKADIHYSPEEYQKLNLAIMRKLCAQYFTTKMMIQIDRTLYQESKREELTESEFNMEQFLNDYFECCYFRLVQAGVNLQDFKRILCQYVLERYPYDYFYIPKKKLIKMIKTTGEIDYGKRNQN